MSYILDALKKSEREKTLGQVPTLETVISDGAKKQPTGTPWWVNLLVFLGVLLAILVIMYFAGLINFDSKKEAFSNSSSPAQNNQVQTEVNQPETVTQTATAVIEQEVEQPDPVGQQSIVEPVQQEVTLPVEPEIQQAVDTEAKERAAEIAEIAAAQQQALAKQEADELAVQQLTQPEVAEVQAPTQQAEPETQQQVQIEEAAVVQQSQNNDYEEALHQSLRNIAVNVVSYSSDARQRFVMLDLTIFKEGDSLPSGAEIIEIQRTGAIVEFQNKRYLLKP